MINCTWRAVMLFLVCACCAVTGWSAPPRSRGGAAQPAEPQKLVGSGQAVTVTLPDPKHPGWLLWKLSAAYGAAQALGKGVEGSVVSVHATMFQRGKPSADMFAPKATYSSANKEIVASGGVFVKSLTEKNTTLRADKVVWSASTNKIVAVGHVVFHDGKSGMVTTGPSLVADTVLKTLRSGPGTATLPKGF